ncbi:PIG-L deacetylase family protein [Sulfurovum sp. CS9]|uniref:PIG-L deacetylase family protein n=1 Tax=Sulfurovum sp. CS9 TaxID=3391146 RepID=UPI0039EA8F5B
MIKKIKKKLKQNIFKKVISKVFNFYKNLETSYPEPLEIKEDDKILILAPHADDESIGCGGLLLKYAKQCDVIFLTDGRYGDNDIEPKQMIEIRKNEVISVMKKLEVNKFKFLDIEDTKLDSGYDIFKTINFNQYDYICIPNSLDQHPDHKAVSKHILKAFKEKRIQKDINILMYEIWGTLPLPNFYTDISDIIESKKEIINMYHSQVKHIDYATKIGALNEYRGVMVTKKSIEVYMIVKVMFLINV